MNNKLKCIFTFDSYEMEKIDYEIDAEGKKLIKIYNNDKYKMIYELYFFNNEDNLDISIKFLKYISDYYFERVITSPQLNFNKEKNHFNISDDEYDKIISTVPFVIGKEFITNEWIDNVFNKINEIFYQEINNYNGSLSEYFISKKKNVLIPSRIYFHLVENKRNSEYPFAFLATYTSIKDNVVKSFPLKNALEEYKNNSNKLRQLISNITSVSESSTFIKEMIDSGEIFYPLNFTEEDAYLFLKEINIYESNGIICRIPNWWATRNETSKVRIDLSEKLQEGLGLLSSGVILSIVPKLYYNGVAITKEEILKLLTENEGLALIKGKWIENNHDKLNQLLKNYEFYSKDGTSLSEVLQIMSGIKTDDMVKTVPLDFNRDDWVNNVINRVFEKVNIDNVSKQFIGKLRPYQFDGFKWLYGMSKLGFGVCLADDMGLGKTIEVLSYLANISEEGKSNELLIVPASLIENWKREIKKFFPTMDYFVLRGDKNVINGKTNAFLTITTYQSAVKSKYIDTIEWDNIILDEAQAIKNYDTLTSIKIKGLKSKMRIALTGTPIENNLLNLWSIYDFINPGLLGERSKFKKFTERKDFSVEDFQNLKKIISPFLLRRLKTDKSIITDLPDKFENNIIINPSKEQIVLYKRRVDILKEDMSNSMGEFEAKGKVLNAILSLKQICNHPSQYLGNDEYKLEDSGKFIQLKNICESIYEKREKVLIFTQFKEIIPALNKLLKDIFKTEGFCIDGNTSLKNRDKYVYEFQNSNIPYMILSVKTAGVGLNLTAAQNVIHFDRWWNPAVENQATDRAFRIGQNKNVSVFKFVTANTVEEVIDEMITIKQKIADDYINSVDGDIFSKMSADELLGTLDYRGDEYE